MFTGTCYTSVFNVSELYSFAAVEHEESQIRNLLNALHILGIPARYGLNTKAFEKYFSNVRDQLFCVLAKLNNLTIVTGDAKKYRNTGLQILEMSSEGKESDIR